MQLRDQMTVSLQAEGILISFLFIYERPHKRSARLKIYINYIVNIYIYYN